MENASKRKFKEGEIIHVIDCWEESAISTTARIIYVSKKERRLLAVINPELYRRYAVEDYGRIIFDTKEDAEQAISKIPSPGSKIYRLVGEDVYQMPIEKIRTTHNEKGVVEISMILKGGASISIERIGKDFFLSKKDVKK